MSASRDDPQARNSLHRRSGKRRADSSHPVAEIKRLERVVDEGDSAATPLILFLAVAIVLAVIVAVVTVIVFFAYYEG